MVHPVLAGFLTSIAMTTPTVEPPPNTLSPSLRQFALLTSPLRSKQYTSANSSYMHARIPASALPVIHADGMMNPMAPESPIRSEAHRSALMYELYSCITLPFGAILMYVSLMRYSISGWLTFRLSSLADFCPAEYGGFPAMTFIASIPWRRVRSLASFRPGSPKRACSPLNRGSSLYEGCWANVSMYAMPSNGTYSPVTFWYDASMLDMAT